MSVKHPKDKKCLDCNTLIIKESKRCGSCAQKERFTRMDSPRKGLDNSIKRECLTCQKKFKIWFSQIKKGHGKYCSHKCVPAWNKGLTKDDPRVLISTIKMTKSARTPEWRERARKMGKASLDKPSWNKGLTKDLDKRLIYDRPTKWGKGDIRISGKNQHAWKGGITPINTAIRNSLEYSDWREKVFERDNYTCQICYQIGGYLHADHIKSFAKYPKLRFDIDNGRTLCLDCHFEITFKRKMSVQKRGWGHNSRIYKEVQNSNRN